MNVYKFNPLTYICNLHKKYNLLGKTSNFVPLPKISLRLLLAQQYMPQQKDYCCMYYCEHRFSLYLFLLFAIDIFSGTKVVSMFYYTI